MKQYIMLKASGLAVAMALGFAAMPSVAADDTYSDTYSTPRDTTQDSGGIQQQQTAPSDVTPPPPTAIDEGSVQSQPRGLQGPVRSDEMASGSTSRSGKSYSGSDKGYMGYLNWQQQNSNTP